MRIMYQRKRKKEKNQSQYSSFILGQSMNEKKVSSNKSHGSLGGWVVGIKLLKHDKMKQLLKPNTETSPTNYFNKFVDILCQQA
uniref:Uncharacterized protein n=1 Tax=Salix viminalis TaxID=40686 RepID=A0A6N2KQA7_SALVM